MKTLSLKLDDDIFEETDNLSSKLKLARNRYINDALKMFNTYKKRQLLKSQLMKESNIVREESIAILHEFELIENENKSV